MSCNGKDGTRRHVADTTTANSDIAVDAAAAKVRVNANAIADDAAGVNAADAATVDSDSTLPPPTTRASYLRMASYH